ncbi:MAG: hypothetical protein ACFCU9_07935, partial [Cyanophyceae cyanobacterium]
MALCQHGTLSIAALTRYQDPLVLVLDTLDRTQAIPGPGLGWNLTKIVTDGQRAGDSIHHIIRWRQLPLLWIPQSGLQG